MRHSTSPGGRPCGSPARHRAAQGRPVPDGRAFRFQVPRQMATVLDPVEAAGSRWVPIRDILDFGLHCLRPVPGLPDEMRYPSIDLDGLPLWGFTYRLITHWLGLDMPPHSGLESAASVLEFLVGRGRACKSGLGRIGRPTGGQCPRGHTGCRGAGALLDARAACARDQPAACEGGCDSDCRAPVRRVCDFCGALVEPRF